MHTDGSHTRKRIRPGRWGTAIGCLVLALGLGAQIQAQDRANDIDEKLKGFDAYMEQLLKDWNAPGVGVGVVVDDTLVFAKGYGYRDYEQKLPFTPTTLCPIASNTKLFTAVAAGLLVEEGKLTWDKPVRDAIPSIRFYDDALNNTVTLRDMLAHRSGITRHDMIWYKSNFSRKELFERLQYLDPKEPPRQTFLYNNLMYAAAGYLIELQAGKSWEEFVRERIFTPLDMHSTIYTIGEMLTQPDFGVPFTEKRDTTEIYKIPYYEETGGMAPAGAIISNIQDLSHWLIALMNEGKYADVQALPPNVLNATLEPAIALPNVLGETKGFWELINTAYGMGRWTGSYRGHLLAFHGGDLDGFHSQVSFMPLDHIGVIVTTAYATVGLSVLAHGLTALPLTDRYTAWYRREQRPMESVPAVAQRWRVPTVTPSAPLTPAEADCPR